jgi:hypothetical protein
MPLSLIHKKKELLKDDIDSLSQNINHTNLMEEAAKSIYQIQTAQSLKTDKFQFLNTFLAYYTLYLLTLSHLSGNTSVKCHINTALPCIAQSLNQLL